MTRAPSFPQECSAQIGRLALLPAGLALLMLLTEGCGPSSQGGPGPRRTVTTRPSNASPITNTDPCANRLHDFCGPLLLYFNVERRLPQRIEELGQVTGFENLRDFTCPVSHQPYIYSPTGIPGLEPGSRVVLYDPIPSHSGVRWGIAVQVPGEDQPLIAKVIALPESKIPRQPAGR
jgi:hypothetical protein